MDRTLPVLYCSQENSNRYPTMWLQHRTKVSIIVLVVGGLGASGVFGELWRLVFVLSNALGK